MIFRIYTCSVQIQCFARYFWSIIQGCKICRYRGSTVLWWSHLYLGKLRLETKSLIQHQSGKRWLSQDLNSGSLNFPMMLYTLYKEPMWVFEKKKWDMEPPRPCSLWLYPPGLQQPYRVAGILIPNLLFLHLFLFPLFPLPYFLPSFLVRYV